MVDRPVLKMRCPAETPPIDHRTDGGYGSRGICAASKRTVTVASRPVIGDHSRTLRPRRRPQTTGRFRTQAGHGNRRAASRKPTHHRRYGAPLSATGPRIWIAPGHSTIGARLVDVRAARAAPVALGSVREARSPGVLRQFAGEVDGRWLRPARYASRGWAACGPTRYRTGH
jgi:hypothetical protein